MLASGVRERGDPVLGGSDVLRAAVSSVSRRSHQIITPRP